MKLFRKLSIVVLSMLLVFSVSMAVACGKGNDNPPPSNKVTVTFMVEGNAWGTAQEVVKGRRITAPTTTPEFSNADYVFTGWYSTATFDEGTLWNFQTGIAQTDMSLYAGYRVVSSSVSDVRRADIALTSSLVWTQRAVSNANDYEVKISSGGTETTLTGTVSFDSDNYLVTFTPSVIPQGGIYNVSVKDVTKSAEPTVATDIMFGGAGTTENPYLVASALDFTGVNQADVAEATYFSLAKNITLETSREAQKAYTFNGVLIGNGRTITLENSNTAIIHKVGEKGIVKNINIAGAISTSLNDSVGTVADFNAGRIEKISTTANVESTSGTTGTLGFANAINDTLADGEGNRGIAGGIVGTNLATGVVYNSKITTSSSSTGTVKASIGGGTIVGYNLGKIEMCTSNGCLGAWNSKETGKSLSNYSYAGGIVGINNGIVVKCSVGASGKLLGQRYTDASQAAAAEGTNNINFGGIAGYNMANGSITESFFAGIRVHGDENVGGIAGLNAGTISDVYVEGVYSSTTTILTYIGGRINIGGIVGKTEGNGSVTNAFVTANVFAYESGAYSVAVNATNSVYVSINPNAKSLNDNANTNPDPVALVAPTGEGNAVVTIEQGYTANLNLAETYLATVNGNSKFYFNDTTIKLNFEKEVLPEETMAVKLYNADGTIFNAEATVAETGKALAGPTVKGFKFVGWALSKGGEVVFDKDAAISLYDLMDYAGADGSASLYAVLEERIPNEGLIVAVWGTQINADKGDDADTIKAAYETFLKAKLGVDAIPYSIEFRLYSESKIAALGSAINADGDIDVVIGVGATANAGNGFDYIARGDMSYEGYTSRKVCLMTDTERAMEFYAYITGKGNGAAEITFNVNGTEITGDVSELLGTTVATPSVTAPEGYEFKGWATTENATEAQVTASAIGYADVKDLLADGKVTLYPVVAEKSYDLVVYIHLSASSSTYITDAEADAVESAIATLLPGKIVNFVRVKGQNGAGFQGIVTSVPNVDLYIAAKGSGDLVFDETYTKVIVGEGHFENTSRYVGILAGADNLDNAVVVYNYLVAALESGETEEPEEPVGPSDPVVSNELVVYIHLSASSSTYITDAEADAVESAIATLLPNVNITFVRVTGKNGSGFETEIASAENVDIYIGGKKINLAESTVFDATYGKTGVGAGHFANDSRYVGILAGADNLENAIVVYNYLIATKQA